MDLSQDMLCSSKSKKGCVWRRSTASSLYFHHLSAYQCWQIDIYSPNTLVALEWSLYTLAEPGAREGGACQKVDWSRHSGISSKWTHLNRYKSDSASPLVIPNLPAPSPIPLAQHGRHSGEDKGTTLVDLQVRFENDRKSYSKTYRGRDHLCGRVLWSRKLGSGSPSRQRIWI